jgi:hypothetical protein
LAERPYINKRVKWLELVYHLFFMHESYIRAHFCFTGPSTHLATPIPFLHYSVVGGVLR